MAKKENVMLLHRYDTAAGKRAFDKMQSVFIQPKYDGVRAVWDGQQFWTRQNKPILVPHIQAYLLERKIEAMLDGELIIVGETFNVTSGIVRQTYDSGAKRRLVYIAFDAPEYQKSYTERYAWLWNRLNPAPLENNTKSLPIVDSPVKVATAWRINRCDWALNQDMNDAVEFRLAKEVDAGWEGIVLKDADALHSYTRSYSCLKYKPTKFMTVTIEDFQPGRGKYTGTLGALICSIKDNSRGVKVSGMDDAMRDRIWHNQDIYRGCQVRIEYQELSEYGVPQFPRYKGFEKRNTND